MASEIHQYIANLSQERKEDAIELLGFFCNGGAISEETHEYLLTFFSTSDDVFF